jgi:L-lysine exporter family protein LysE/ArgO
MHSFIQPWLAGLSLGASLIVAVGAQNTFVLRQGLRREHVTAVVASCIALDAILMTLGVEGVAAALGTHPVLLAAMGIAGAAFLLAYAWQAARRALSDQALAAQTAGAAQSLASVLMQGLACTLLNPHVYLDTLLLVGAVGAQQAPALRTAFLVGAISASAIWFVALGFGARLLAPLFARAAAWRWLDAGVAITMGALGLRLAAGVMRAV